MEYQWIMQQDYDRKLKFRKKQFFCYSKKEFNRRNRERRLRVIGEITGQQAEEGEDRVWIGPWSFAVLKKHAKSRILYAVSGYVQTDGGYVAVLKSRLPLYWLVLGGVAAAAALVGLALMLRPGALSLDPIPVDPNVGVIENDDTQKKESEEGGGAVTLTYSLEAELSLSTGGIDMYFLNPNASNHDIALALYLVDDQTSVKIAESGRIQPGFGLTDMQFIDGSVTLSQGDYNGVYVVTLYDTGTGEKALVESTITDVIVTVSP